MLRVKWFIGWGMLGSCLILIYMGHNFSQAEQPDISHPQINHYQESLLFFSNENSLSKSDKDEACFLHPNFPAKVKIWCVWIESYANLNQLDPNLVAALITQESAGDPNASSVSGAVGLLQIMPNDPKVSSFICEGGPCFADRPSTVELLDPRFNIYYGTKLFAGLVSRYGNLRDALKAYGPMDAGYDYADKVLKIYHSSQDFD